MTTSKNGYTRNVDLTKLRCAWMGATLNTRKVWRSHCHLNAKHVIGGVPICNRHYNLMRRYVEKRESYAVSTWSAPL